MDLHLSIEDPLDFPDEDLADLLAEWSFENAQDEYEAKRDE